MKLVKDIKLECEVAKRMMNGAHAEHHFEDGAYYQGVMVALNWVLEQYDDPYIPVYGGPVECD